MAIVVKMPASEVSIKVTDIDLDFFNSNIFDTNSDKIKYLGDKPSLVKFYTDW